MAIYIFKRFPIDKATILLLIVPFLFLPLSVPNALPVKLPLLPPLDKKIIPILAILAIFYFGKVRMRWLPQTAIGIYLCLGAMLNPFFTVFTNMDDIHYGPTFLPGLKFTESLSLSLWVALSYCAPFMVGYSILNTNKAHEEIVKLIVVLGLIYSVFVLYEVRMSPQLHTKIYGFFPHDDWMQQIRAGGFRPVVFLGHGLMVALFECLMVVAAFTLWRQQHELARGKGFWLLTYFLVLLVLTKSYSALSYLVLFFVIVASGSAMRYRFMAFIAVVILFYPGVRSYVPIADIVNFFNDINPERASSLKFRIDNEDILLAKANERSVFGWGTWGRNRVFDPVTGVDVSVTDGVWILYYGQAGWHGHFLDCCACPC
jgi:hypothetical protein